MENPEPSRGLIAVRRAVADDADRIRALAVDNGMFAPDVHQQRHRDGKERDIRAQYGG